MLISNFTAVFKRLGFVQPVLFLGLSLCSYGARSAVYNVTDDYALSNPNGEWRYGYSTSLGSAFVPYALTSTVFGGIGGIHQQYFSSALTLPAIFKNTTAATLHPFSTITMSPGQLAMHPGPSGEVAIARWTAPDTYTIAFSGSFQGIGGVNTSTDVHVLHNGFSVFDGSIQGSSSLNSFANFADGFNVSAGDTIDFALGFGGANYFFDSTALDAQITTSTVVPLPPAVGLFATGLIALFSLQRRKLRV